MSLSFGRVLKPCHMEITSKKEYYLALVLQETFLERGFGDLTEEEEARLSEVGEAINAYEEELSKEYPKELGERDWIEVTDRTDFVISVVHILLEHPAIAQTPELAKQVEEAQTILGNVYQQCGEKY